ncbi:MAG: immune inhibitor A [Anaerolineales bacterium]
MKSETTTITTIVIISIFILICCLCACLIFFSAFTIFAISASETSPVSLGAQTPTPSLELFRPTPVTGELPTQPPAPTPLDLEPLPSNTPRPDDPINPSATSVPVIVSTETLLTLQNALVPENNPRDLAQRLNGIADIPLTVPPPAVPYQVGDQQTFWATNTDTAESFEVDTTLRYITPHTYWWIGNDVSYSESELEALAEDFENHIYPTVREFFGSEWSPGVDGDEHLYILYVEGLGFSLAGYFSSADEVHPLAHEYSNAHEMFFLNADNVDLGEEFTYGVLAHEFQHMIHWHGDRNEETWMNEGFSEVAAFLAGYEQGGFDWVYTNDPDLQLNTWPGDGDTTPHYGAAFLFLTYFLDRYGEEATKALVANPQNGFASIDLALTELGATDPHRGGIPTANDVFQDWTIASYLQDPDVGDGRFDYSNYPAAPNPDDTETITSCPKDPFTRDVTQYGVDYIRITCEGTFTLRFTGSTATRVLPEDPYSGQYAFYSNRGDESNMTLTRQFDFTAYTGPLTLSYWMWYDLETDYDYLYLEASLDGETWQILTTPSGTAEDPSGNSYGWAYNGQTNGWKQETVDLSAFAGQQVYLRFEYITDAAVNGDGFLLDDVEIPEIGYFTDFETDNGGWDPAGFVRIQNLLPQTYRLALITKGIAGTEVQYLPLSADNLAEIPLSLGGDVDEVILVISGTTQFTRQKAVYQLEIQ